MELPITSELAGIILVICGSTFMLWLAPQAVGGKPFLLGLEDDKNKK